MVVRWGISFNRGTLGSLPDGRGMLWDLTSFYCQNGTVLPLTVDLMLIQL